MSAPRGITRFRRNVQFEKCLKPGSVLPFLYSGLPDVIGGLFLIYYMLTGTFVFFLFGIVLHVFLVLAHASTRLRKTEVTIKREKIRTLMGLFLAALGQEHDVGESSSTDTCTVMWFTLIFVDYDPSIQITVKFLDPIKKALNLELWWKKITGKK